MLPWLAMGHLLPFLQLSKTLARKNHRISFLTTPKTLKKLPPNPSHLINFIQFPLPPTPNLPENAELTIDLPSDDLRPYLRQAFDTLRQTLPHLIQSKQIPTPDLIVFDYAAYWLPPIAATLRIPCAFFGVFSAAVLSFYGPPSALLGGPGARSTPEDYTVKPSWIPFPSTMAYRLFEARAIVKPGILPDASGVSEAYRFGKSIEGCQFVLIRSCDELESEWLKLLGEIYEKRIVPVGFLPAKIDSIEEERHAALDWLDEQEDGSVVYVAFGSEVKLSVAEVEEIAGGLELSGLPFVWALWAGSAPDGLVERVNGGGGGRVWVGWVPQVRILAHAAVGGFLTHGGWNSIVEGLGFGRVMVVLPVMFDQGLNARSMVEKGFGLEVPRLEDGFFTGRGIAESLRMAMVEEEGEMLREKAKECKKLFGNEELHEYYVRESIKRCREIVKLG